MEMLEAVVSSQGFRKSVMQSEGVVRVFTGPRDVGSWLVS